MGLYACSVCGRTDGILSLNDNTAAHIGQLRDAFPDIDWRKHPYDYFVLCDTHAHRFRESKAFSTKGYYCGFCGHEFAGSHLEGWYMRNVLGQALGGYAFTYCPECRDDHAPMFPIVRVERISHHLTVCLDCGLERRRLAKETSNKYCVNCNSTRLQFVAVWHSEWCEKQLLKRATYVPPDPACPRCAQVIEKSWRYCSKCGWELAVDYVPSPPKRSLLQRIIGTLR